MDAERNRISLGMKDLYILDGDDIEETSEQEPNEASRDNDLMNHTDSISFPDTSLLGAQNMDVECENAEFPNLAQTESRASVPPLEVTLDEINQSDVDNLVGGNQEHLVVRDRLGEKAKRQTKKKAKEERYFNLHMLSLY